MKKFFKLKHHFLKLSALSSVFNPSDPDHWLGPYLSWGTKTEAFKRQAVGTPLSTVQYDTLANVAVLPLRSQNYFEDPELEPKLS